MNTQNLGLSDEDLAGPAPLTSPPPDVYFGTSLMKLPIYSLYIEIRECPEFTAGGGDRGSSQTDS